MWRFLRQIGLMSQLENTKPVDAPHSAQVDEKRRRISTATDRQKKASLGQFMTPTAIAQFTASLFPSLDGEPMRLLDAGAGTGSLSGAVLDRRPAGLRWRYRRKGRLL